MHTGIRMHAHINTYVYDSHALPWVSAVAGACLRLRTMSPRLLVDAWMVVRRVTRSSATSDVAHLFATTASLCKVGKTI